MQHKRIIASVLFTALLFSACSTNFTPVKRRISYNSSVDSVTKGDEAQTLSQVSSTIVTASEKLPDSSPGQSRQKNEENNNSTGSTSHFHGYKTGNNSSITYSSVPTEPNNMDALKIVDQAIEKAQNLQGFNFSYHNTIIYNGSRNEETGNMIFLKSGSFLKQIKSIINGMSADEIIYRNGGTLYIKNISGNRKADIYKTVYRSCDELYYSGMLNIKTNKQDRIESKEQQNGCCVVKYQSAAPCCFNDVFKILKFDHTAKINRAELTYTIKNGYISVSEQVFTIHFKNNTYQYTMIKTFQNPETPLIISTPSYVKQLG